MANEKLGFTFYPNDWWTSETFFNLDPLDRYIYLECLFIMYKNNGYLKAERIQVQNRLRTEITQQTWDKITQLFTSTELGFTSATVRKRLRKKLSNIENGKRGGRPIKTQTKPKQNPSLERETEIKENTIESIFNEITSQQIWMEEKSMFLKSRNLENTKRLLNDWLLNQGTENLQRDIEDIKRHFVNTMKLKTINEINPNLGGLPQGTI